MPGQTMGASPGGCSAWKGNSSNGASVTTRHGTDTGEFKEKDRPAHSLARSLQYYMHNQ